MKTITKPKAGGQDWPWIGQTRLGAALLSMLKQDRWPATVMFAGPAHLGKATVAHWIAQRDLCQKATAYPCDKCQDCRAVIAGTHADCLVIEPDEAQRINKQDVQQILQGLVWKRTASVAHRRWVIISDVDRLSENIGNTLLKLIEEPPPTTAIVLTSSHPEKVLPTIASRTVQYRWQIVSEETLDGALRLRWPELSVTTRQTIIAQAAGRPGVAMELAKHPQVIEEEWVAVRGLLTALERGRIAGRTEVTITDLDRCERIIRDLLLLSIDAAAQTWPDRVDTFDGLASRLGSHRLLQIARRLIRRQAYLTQNVQPSFFLHDLLL